MLTVSGCCYYDGFYAQFSECTHGMYAAVVEFDALAYPDWAGTYDKHLLLAVTLTSSFLHRLSNNMALRPQTRLRRYLLSCRQGYGVIFSEFQDGIQGYVYQVCDVRVAETYLFALRYRS